MKVNYVLMYGTPFLKYREFEKFEDVSKFLVNKRIVNYSIFKKLEDKEEVEMIYRDSDIRFLEKYAQDKDKEIQILKHRLQTANEYIESRKENMIPEHYDDLKYIINESDLDSSW